MNLKKNLGLGKLIEKIEKKNFYVMVALCVGILIFSGLFFTSRNIISSIGYENEGLLNDPNELRTGTENEMSKNVSSSNLDENLNESVVNKTYSAIVPAVESGSGINSTEGKNVTLKEEKDLKKTAKLVSTNSTKESDAGKSKTATILFEMPVKGKLSFDYSDNKPVYSKTLNEWRTHNGIDIKEEPGTAVKAVRDGIVKEVKNDPRYGYTVIIEHDNGLKTLYAAMVKSDMVVSNQKVKAGDVLGSLGNTAPFEALEPAHLHFEVFKDGKNVNPKLYLPRIGE